MPRRAYNVQVTVKRPFEVIEGGKADTPRRPRKPHRRTLAAWRCKVCLVDIGIAMNTLVKIKFGPMEDERGRISGGTDGWVCVFCLTRGKITHSER